MYDAPCDMRRSFNTLSAMVTGEMRRNRSLYSRLHCRLNIDGHTPEDTADYIQHRLKKAGVKSEIFTSDAIAMLHEAALGSLRDVDRVATAALKSASRKRRKLVERDTIEKLLDTDQAR